MLDRRGKKIVTVGRWLNLRKNVMMPSAYRWGWIDGGFDFYYWANDDASTFTYRDARAFVDEYNEKFLMDEKAVVIVVCNEEGNILILRRARGSSRQGWCLPGGHVDEGENLREAACRELEEETGIESYPSELIFISTASSSRGERVIIFALPRFVDEKIRLSEEHDSYAWGQDAIEWAGNTELFIQIFYDAMEEK